MTDSGETGARGDDCGEGRQWGEPWPPLKGLTATRVPSAPLPTLRPCQASPAVLLPYGWDIKGLSAELGCFSPRQRSAEVLVRRCKYSDLGCLCCTFRYWL